MWSRKPWKPHGMGICMYTCAGHGSCQETNRAPLLLAFRWMSSVSTVKTCCQALLSCAHQQASLLMSRLHAWKGDSGECDKGKINERKKNTIDCQIVNCAWFVKKRLEIPVHGGHPLREANCAIVQLWYHILFPWQQCLSLTTGDRKRSIYIKAIEVATTFHINFFQFATSKILVVKNVKVFQCIRGPRSLVLLAFSFSQSAGIEKRLL